MRIDRLSACALFALVASSLAMVTGCASSFGNGYGYDEQACVERSLRRTTDMETVAQARTEFDEECRHGVNEACSALGVMHEVGVGVPKNVARAVALYARACHAGNRRGCTNLGIARAEGFVGVANPAEGVRLLEPACDGKDARACLYLARMHESGTGAVKDPFQAAHLFELACEGEEATACLALGDIFAEAKESHSAREFYGKGCLNGDAASCARLSQPSSRSTGALAEAERR